MEGDARAALEEVARVNVESCSNLFEMLANLLPMHPTDFDSVVGNIRRITEALAGGLQGTGGHSVDSRGSLEHGAATETGEEVASVAEGPRESKLEPTEKVMAGGVASQEPVSPSLFARLPGDRYRIIFGKKNETVPMLAGLRVVEFLLHQPGKAAHVLEINRAICEGNPRAATIADASARSAGQKGLDGFTPDALQQPDPCSDEDLEEAKELVKSLDDQAAKAREGGEHEKAEKLEDSADTARKWVREQEGVIARKRRGQPSQDSEVETVRIKLTNNFRNACAQLRTKHGFPELAEHLQQQIDRGTEWKYRPVPGVEWAFDPALNPH